MGPYIQQTILLLVPPALFAGSIYMMLGKVIMLLEAENLSFLKKRWLAKLFVCGDMLSFSIQAAGKHYSLRILI